MYERTQTIAVVDDDASLAQALVRLLRAASFHARSYVSAEDFLADPAHAQADFLVVDIQLGGMSGFELRERLAQEGTLPPMAYITAHDESATRDRAQAGGCVAYLRKPFSGERLLEAIRAAFAAGRKP